MQFPVTVLKGKEKAQVVHPIDLDGWVKDGWKVEGLEEEKKPRDILIDRATELELEFANNISNKDLKALIDAKEAELKA